MLQDKKEINWLKMQLLLGIVLGCAGGSAANTFEQVSQFLSDSKKLWPIRPNQSISWFSCFSVLHPPSIFIFGLHDQSTLGDCRADRRGQEIAGRRLHNFCLRVPKVCRSST